MAIPKYDELMIPVLEVLSDKKEHRITEIVDILAKKLKLTNEELTKLMIKHNLGIQVKTKIEIKKIDEDFFSEE